MTDIYLLYEGYEEKITYDSFKDKYSNKYNENYLLELFNNSDFLSKINKQIKHIKSNNLYHYFSDKFNVFKDKFISLITAKIINYNYIIQFFHILSQNEKTYISDIFCDIMDLYTMTRIYRSFDIDKVSPYESTNIIIYAGDYHIQNYIKHFEELGLQPMYMFTSSDTNEYACIKVNDFNIEYL